MTTEIYTATFVRADNVRAKIVLRKGKRYWIASDRTWFWLTTGIETAPRRGKKPGRIVLSSIKKGDHVNKVRKVVAYDYTGEAGRASGGPPSIRNLRETGLLWIDEMGVRFRKDGGWSTKYDEDKLRLNLSTIKLRQEAADD